jgi:uncharacterized membrane protein
VNQLSRYWGLAAAIALGLALRFWNLDLKPLWLDEVITLLFSLGHRYEDIPRETLLPLVDLLENLHWQPQSCGAIAQTVNIQSTHPPLFFCAMHAWLGHFQEHSLRWQVRSLPALFGVGAIIAIYALSRVAFSHRAGLWAAGLMAVSPFAVYLSQEARHYTLPMLVITLSLIPFVQLCEARSVKSSQNLGAWFAWVSLNSLGFYIHYFCLLAFVAQVATMICIVIRRRQWHHIIPMAIATGIFALSLVPWLPSLLGHSQRSETDWLQFGGGSLLDWIGPMARLFAGVMVSVVIFPVEGQPLPIIIVSGVLMLAIAAVVGHHLWKGIPKLVQAYSGTESLGIFLLVLWVEYLMLVYGLHKDLTLAFRYNFVFYPALCALLAASLTAEKSKTVFAWGLIVIGIISTGFVVTDFAFQKPFAPQQTAEKLLHNASPALVVVKDYQGWQDIALGLSTAFAVQQFNPQNDLPIRWTFIKTTQQLQTKWSEFTLWHIGALRAKQMNAIALESTSQKTGVKTVVNCTEIKPIHQEMGVQSQPFRCK